MMVKVSVITPVYNSESLLFKTFESLKRQTFYDFEWIIIDDCSNEATKRIIQKIVDSDVHFKIRLVSNRQNMKQAYSRNIGIDLAEGVAIKFLDADDMLTDNSLEIQWGLLDDNNLNTIVFGRTMYLECDKKYVGVTKKSLFKRTTGLELLPIFLQKQFFSHGGCLIPKNVLIKNNVYYDERLVTDEDGDFLIRLMLANIDFVGDFFSFYIYRQHDLLPRVSKNDSHRKIKARVSVLKKLYYNYPNNMKRRKKINALIYFRLWVLYKELDGKDAVMARYVLQERVSLMKPPPLFFIEQIKYNVKMILKNNRIKLK